LTATAAELDLQLPDCELAFEGHEIAGIEALRMAAATAQHPEEPPRLDRMAEGLDRSKPPPHHENN